MVFDKTNLGTPFHLNSFNEIIDNEFNLERRSINQKYGKYDFFLSKKTGIKRLISPLEDYFIPYGGPILNQQFKDSNGKLSDLINNSEAMTNANYIRVRLPPLYDVTVFQKLGYKLSKSFTSIINLTEGSEIIWNNFKKSLRKKIRKCERQKLDIYESKDINDIIDFRNLLDNTLPSRLFLPSTDFFVKFLTKTFEDFSCNLLVVKKNKLLGGAIHLHSKDWCYSWISASSNEGKKLGINPLIKWHSIVNAVNTKKKFYDMMGLGGSKGIKDYKRSFGGKEIPIYTATKRKGLYSLIYKPYSLIKKFKDK